MSGHFGQLDTVAYFLMVGSKKIKAAYQFYKTQKEYSRSLLKKEERAFTDETFSEQLLFVLQVWNKKFEADIFIQKVTYH